MKIGFIGLGKLGLPCALAIESKGHEVIGYDISDRVKKIIETRKIPYQEEGAQELLEKSKIRFEPMEIVLKWADLVFVAVQTPHEKEYEGVTRMPEVKADFNYSYLENACKKISEILDHLKKDQTIIIISTVLPMTINTKIKPLLSRHVKLCYNPFFIAMTTCIPDFLHPEIVLFGVDDKSALKKVQEFYQTISNAPFKAVSIINAELVKVNYNTFIGLKINFGNNLGQISYKINESLKKMGMPPNADADEVIDCLSDCTDRIISTKYLVSGMPDGGGCHPRDNIALSWFAEQLGLKANIYEEQMDTREKHIEWFIELIQKQLKNSSMDAVVLGKTYKPHTNLELGSPSILMQDIMKNEYKINCSFYDPYVDGNIMDGLFDKPHIYFIGTKHDEFAKIEFPKGSIIVDPFGYIPYRQNIKVLHVGRAG